MKRETDLPERTQEVQERQFPIQGGHSIPWSEAERAYRVYAHFQGTRQSLERLAERGGFGPEEFGLLYAGLDPFGSRPRRKAPAHVLEPA